MKTATQFLEQLVAEFPELREQVEEDSGALHLQMASFARMTQTAIDAGDFETLRRQFMLADRFFRDAGPDLQNAFHVSYLEHLNLCGPHGQRARDLMSTALRKGWQDIMDYLDLLFRKGQKDRQELAPPGMGGG